MELIKNNIVLVLLMLSYGVNAQVNWYTFEEAFEAVLGLQNPVHPFRVTRNHGFETRFTDRVNKHRQSLKH